MFGLSIAAIAEEYDVPSGLYPTLQAAVDAAELSPDQDNYINLINPVLITSEMVDIGISFNATRRLTFQPSSELARATIASVNPSQAIFHIAGPGGGYITLQDLDIVRNITNNYHLIIISEFSNVVIERCRIGSIWTSPGGAGWSNLEIIYPYGVIVRNCLFFSYALGTFTRGIHAFSFTDPSNSLLLYNNVVADYSGYGIHIQATAAESLVLLRNNVVINHPDYPAAMEPVCYLSDVTAAPRVVTSHNTAFSSAGHVETIGGVQSILGTNGAIVLARGAVDPTFLDRSWNLIPAWDPNPDFFRLRATGPLHVDSSVWGTTVSDGAPDLRDVAVTDDLERDGRPGGTTPHTDRGADQIEPPIAPVPAFQLSAEILLIVTITMIFVLIEKKRRPRNHRSA